MILLPCFFVGWNCATPKKEQNLIWIHHSSNVSSSSQLCLSSWPPTEFHGFHCLPKTELTSSSLLTHSFTHWLTYSLTRCWSHLPSNHPNCFDPIVTWKIAVARSSRFPQAPRVDRHLTFISPVEGRIPWLTPAATAAVFSKGNEASSKKLLL